jgi:hypothetical protein
MNTQSSHNATPSKMKLLIQESIIDNDEKHNYDPD